MIQRKRKISPKADEVGLYVSYTMADVRKTLAKYFRGIAEMSSVAFAMSLPHTEDDIRHYFEHTTFANYDSDVRTQLAAWAFNVAVRKGFLIQSGIDENCFFLSPSLDTKVGRPKKEQYT